jgi:acetyltransferase-like isoleucine patch superfamily enzyme
MHRSRSSSAAVSAIVWAEYQARPRIGSLLRRALTRLRNPSADVRFDGPVTIGRGLSVYMPGGGTFIVSAGAEIGQRLRVDIGPTGRLTVGPGTRIGDDVVITCDTSIDIGSRCDIGAASYLVDGNHRFRDPDVPFIDQGADYRPLTIGDDVRVGPKCTLVNNIGDGAVIGPNSIVTRPVPARTTVLGVPARPLDT